MPCEEGQCELDGLLAAVRRKEAENERLRTIIKAGADRVEKLAFSMRPPNPYTPDLVMIAQVMRHEAYQQSAVKEK